MATTNAAVIPYQRGQAPAQYDAGRINAELAKIQRGIRAIAIRTVVADTTLSSADETVLADTTGGAISLTLPRADGSRNLKVTVLNIGSGTLTVVGTVSGSVDQTYAQWAGATIVGDGTAFYSIGSP